MIVTQIVARGCPYLGDPGCVTIGGLRAGRLYSSASAYPDWSAAEPGCGPVGCPGLAIWPTTQETWISMDRAKCEVSAAPLWRCTWTARLCPDAVRCADRTAPRMASGSRTPTSGGSAHSVEPGAAATCRASEAISDRNAPYGHLPSQPRRHRRSSIPVRSGHQEYLDHGLFGFGRNNERHKLQH